MRQWWFFENRVTFESLSEHGAGLERASQDARASGSVVLKKVNQDSKLQLKGLILAQNER